MVAPDYSVLGDLYTALTPEKLASFEKALSKYSEFAGALEWLQSHNASSPGLSSFAVPEPATLAFVGVGAVALGMRRRGSKSAVRRQ